jgi:cytochrome c553
MKKIVKMAAIKAAVFAAIAVASSGVAQAAEIKANPEAAKNKVSMCLGCHNIEGWRASYPEIHKVPKIAGQSATYIANSLNAYKKGDRKHPTMRAIATSLTDQDIADISAWYEAQGATASR